MTFEHALDRTASRRLLVGLCAVGVAIRLVFALLAGELEFQSDEANYVYLAATWNYFGFYSDSYRYLWPPGYPFFLAACLEWFRHDALLVAKLLQVAASASIGWFVMLFAERLFSRRAALVAGVTWALYLPLIGFTHYLWTETLFLAVTLPCWYLFLLLLQAPEEPRAERHVMVAGVLFAASLYLKEVGLYLAPVLATLLLLCDWRANGAAGALRGLRRGSLFLLTITALVLPWTLRNFEVYGRLVPVGTSLGENAYIGLNEDYKNFDTFPLSRHRLDRPTPSPRAYFIAAEKGSGWARAERFMNTPDRLARNAYRGFKYAREHPGWFVRSRIKKLADAVVPVSFFVRHQALDHYASSPLGAPRVRKVLVVLSTAASAAVLAMGLLGYLLLLRDRSAFWLIGIVSAYFASTALIVAMSRFRIPLVPFLIVLAAGLLTGQARTLARGRKLAASLVVLLVLGSLWWIDYPELRGLLALAWEGAGR